MLGLQLLLSGPSLLAAPPARQHGEPAAVVEARRHNADAEKLFNLGLFEHAAAAYHRAYLARPIAAFLYNIGQCHWRMGGRRHLNKALHYYESFRNSVEDAEQGREVEQKIAEVKIEIARLDAARKRPRFYQRWWFWTLTGVAVAGVTTALVVGLRPEDQKPVEGPARPGLFSLP